MIELDAEIDALFTDENFELLRAYDDVKIHEVLAAYMRPWSRTGFNVEMRLTMEANKTMSAFLKATAVLCEGLSAIIGDITTEHNALDWGAYVFVECVDTFHGRICDCGAWHDGPPDVPSFVTNRLFATVRHLIESANQPSVT